MGEINYLRDSVTGVTHDLMPKDGSITEAKLSDELQEKLQELELGIGSPLVASTAAEMTDTDKIYVYTGSETGYTSGNWYYYNGSAWTSGGVYNSMALETDTTLQVSGAAADAKVVGDEVTQLKEDLDVNTEALEGAVFTEEGETYYPWESTDSRYNNVARVFWTELVPAGALLTEVRIYIANVGSNPSILVDVWEVDGDTLTKVRSAKTTDVLSNQENIIPISCYAEKPLMISYTTTGVNARYYRKNQTGYSFKYSTDVSESTTTLSYSGLSGFSNMKLIGGFAYLQTPKSNTDFFSGYLSGNMIVFGDSTVDGSSVTDHTNNVIGTDRTASTEPYVFTSILEGMIRTFNGSSVRVYNAGFGGKTLNYIADNYSAIMAAFTDVKSALLVIDANSANGTRSEYAENIRLGLERMIALLKEDGIAIAIASPQPMFFYTADNNGLPAINSAGEFAIAVNIGKDICAKYNLPFINLGDITNKVMDSPYFTSSTFFGDRIHFGDGGHKFEAYELYGELIHPIIIYDGGKKLIRVESNQCELSENSGISATVVNGYRSIVLQATHTRTDVLARFYIISKIPFKLGGVEMSWAYNSDMYVDGVLYTEGVATMGEVIPAGTHEVTIKPEAEKIVRFSGLMIESGE